MHRSQCAPAATHILPMARERLRRRRIATRSDARTGAVVSAVSGVVLGRTIHSIVSLWSGSGLRRSWDAVGRRLHHHSASCALLLRWCSCAGRVLCVRAASCRARCLAGGVGARVHLVVAIGYWIGGRDEYCAINISSAIKKNSSGHVPLSLSPDAREQRQRRGQDDDGGDEQRVARQ